ncbi:MAG TPA: Uma2 family endonuclease [Gemmatimonadota bacterium]|nr:Uma2 family endonuclease [Gemmatimonadota bacterium]
MGGVSAQVGRGLVGQRAAELADRGAHGGAEVRGTRVAGLHGSGISSRPSACQTRHGRGFLPFAPDLCVEIVSPSNTPAEIHEKVLEYLEGAARLVWVVHPEAETVTEYRSPTEIRIFRVTDDLDGGETLSGFRAPVASLFPR